MVLTIGTGLRVWLWWHYGMAAGVEVSALPVILAGGLLNDAIVALYLFLPLAAYLAFLPDRWHASRVNRSILSAGSWLTVFALAFLAVAESYFFDEFNARFNLVAFDYLAYPT